MEEKLKSILRITLGWVFIFLGIAGLLLPFLQGILFLVIGLYLLSHESPRAKNLLKKVRERFPSLARKLDQVKAKNKHLLKRIRKRGRSS